MRVYGTLWVYGSLCESLSHGQLKSGFEASFSAGPAQCLWHVHSEPAPSPTGPPLIVTRGWPPSRRVTQAVTSSFTSPPLPGIQPERPWCWESLLIIMNAFKLHSCHGMCLQKGMAFKKMFGVNIYLIYLSCDQNLSSGSLICDPVGSSEMEWSWVSWDRHKPSTIIISSTTISNNCKISASSHNYHLSSHFKLHLSTNHNYQLQL